MSNDIRTAINKSSSEYDIIAACYEELLKNNLNMDMCFRHIIADESVTNSNYSPSQYLGELLRGKTIRENFDPMDFMTLKENLLDFYDRFTNSNDFAMTGSYCFAPNSAIFALMFLYEFNSYVNNTLRNKSDYYTMFTFGPLNSPHNIKETGCVVYLKPRRSLLDGKDFRNKTGPMMPGDYFSAIQIAQCTEFKVGAGVAQIKTCKTDFFSRNNDEPQSNIPHNLHIAYIPYIGISTFEFKDVSTGSKIDQRSIQSPCLFYIDYPSIENDLHITRVINLLDSAIDNGANIVVFPEFIMSSSMLEAIQHYLKNMPENNRSKLLYVFAGTTFEQADSKGQSFHNILHIITREGALAGKYYKYSPFIERDTDAEGNQRELIRENLAEPGKECTLIDIEGIGRILPAVCRDIVEQDYTLHLAQKFLPGLILAPSWSKSLRNGFYPQLKNIAKTLHSVSIVCNCCNAVAPNNGSFEQEIGTCFKPRKIIRGRDKDNMTADKNPFYRDNECSNRCAENGGCIFLITIDYSTGRYKYSINSVKLTSASR